MAHVLIIGAGPAGSIAATHVARAGVRVSLVEQHRFPRDKVCGECLSARGIDVLRRLDLLRMLQHRDPPILRRALIHAPNGTSASIELPEPMLGVSRAALDETLLRAARDAGAVVLQPARCEAIESNGSVVARIRRLEPHECMTIPAEYVLIADGKSPTKTRHRMDLGVQAHFSDVVGARDAIELFGVDGHYGGLAPVEDGRWNAAFSVPAKRVATFHGDLDAMFEQIVSENRSLAARLRGATRATPWLASPLVRSTIASRWPARVIPIGNAAASIEPIGGEGMGLAMWSADLAAGAILDALRRGIDLDVDRLRQAFRRLWRVRGQSCRWAGLAVSSPKLAQIFVRTSARVPRPVVSLALRAIGKAPQQDRSVR